MINGYSDLLLHTVKLDASAADMLTDIRDAGERASALTRQLLTFSRHRVVDPDVLELSPSSSEIPSGCCSGDRRAHSAESIALFPAAVGSRGCGTARTGHRESGRERARAMPDGGTLTVSTSHITLSEGAAASA